MEYNPEYVHFESGDDIIDKWCIAADSVCDIKSKLAEDVDFIKEQLVQIKEAYDVCCFPFSTTNANFSEPCPYKFVYVDPAFQDMMHDEEVLKWTDLKIGDIVNGLKAQITKAIDIMKELIEDLDIIDGEQTKELKAVKEAEQFLKEAEG